MFKRILSFLFLCIALNSASAQTLGGSSIYSFLKLNASPQSGSLGGRNVSAIRSELGMLNENPALLSKTHHAQVSANFNFLAPGITGFYGLGAYHVEKRDINLALGVMHVQYGQQDQTDASGNSLGVFRAFDQMISVSASGTYSKKWQYGVTLKAVQSAYGPYRSLGLAGDVGLSYWDEEKKFRAGFSSRNMGSQLTTYAGKGEDLPFDLVLGISKELEKAPIRFSITAQRIHQFDILYNDTLFTNENYGVSNPKSFLGKLISHFVLGTELLVGDKITVSAGYNILRSQELRIRNIASGLTGFSYGIQLKLKRFDFNLARSQYLSSLSLNQVSINMKLKP
ncbi:MAG: type secretion system protein PorQ [Bacteroidota bacterium]